MKRGLVLLVALPFLAGCWHSRKAGKNVEEWVALQHQWSTNIHQIVAAHFSGVNPMYVKTLRDNIQDLCKKAGIPEPECSERFDPGLDAAYVAMLRESIPELCKAADVSDPDCKELDPGPGDKQGDPDPPPEWPRR